LSLASGGILAILRKFDRYLDQIILVNLFLFTQPDLVSNNPGKLVKIFEHPVHAQ
jgi:hypothetical protein